MIIAEREHLEDLMQQQAVEIRVKEEQILSKSFRTLSNIATYLAASAFAILRATPTYLSSSDAYLNENTGGVKVGFRDNNEEETIFLQTVTCAAASCALCLCILVLVVCSWCLIFGNELAFRGEDIGSMTRAVDGLYAERKICIRFFNAAIACIVLAGVTQVNLLLRGSLKFIPMVYLVFVGVLAATYMRFRVRPRFKFAHGDEKNNANDILFTGGFDPEIRRNVETWRGDDSGM